MNILLLMLLVAEPRAFDIAKTYENIAEVSDDFVKIPFDLAYGKDGRVFVSDPVAHRVHVWNDDGAYAFSFGERGEGPGQFNSPYFMDVHEDKLYVYEDGARRISIFGMDGTFIKFLRVPVRVQRFAVLNPNLILIADQRSTSPTDSTVGFALYDQEGKVVRQLQEYKNDLLIIVRGENNNATVKAYGSEADIQYMGDGVWAYGYGSQTKLHRIDGQGMVLEDIQFDLVTGPPTQEEIDDVNDISFPTDGGRRMTLKDLPDIHMRFDRDKAYYTQFTIQGDKAIFALHPLGGTNGTCVGYHKGSYVVCDLKTGKRLYRGKYNYNEDSRVWFENGRVLGMVINEDDDYVLSDFSFPKK